jgi:hypothetical protein
MATSMKTHQSRFAGKIFLSAAAILLFLNFALQAAGMKNRKEWFVSPSGKAFAKGTKEDPYASLVQARNAIRQAKKANPGLQNQSVTVWLRQGVYQLAESFDLDETDSGSKKNPVTYRSWPGEKVSVTGAVRISPAQVKPISDKSVTDRIIEVAARPNIREIDLGKLNLPDTIRWKLAGFGRPYVASGMELFINGKPYALAGYPNQDKIQIHPEDVIDPGIKDNKAYPGKIRFPGDRIKKWPEKSDAMVFGCFTYAWASDQLRIGSIDPDNHEIAFADAHVYGISGKKEWNKYRIFNLLEEIDQPGEYYVDNKAGKLYFYPYSATAQNDTIMVSILGTPLVRMEQASNIRFEGITFEAGRGIGISMVNGTNNLVTDCTFRNLGMLAVRIGLGYDSFGEHLNNFDSSGGKNNEILNCTIENIGSGGICLGGGNRKTLEPAGNLISDCEFTHCGRLTYSYKCPVNIHGVGNIIRHCTFNESPATEIYLHGNNHLIEYNLIQDACTFMDDQGAFYLGRNPSESGTVIRYNLFKNCGRFGMTMAVYMDDGACGTSVYGNIFYKAGSRTIMMGGGSYNPMTANLFIDTPMAIHLDNRLGNWAKDWLKPGDLFEKDLNEINFKNPPYAVQYPWLVNYFDNHPELPKGNNIAYNLFVRVKEIHNGKAEWGPVEGNNRKIDQDIDLDNAAEATWTKEELAGIRKLIPGFKPIKIGETGRRDLKVN